jgi:NarL family two-component system response regulator YdfI
LIRVLVWTKSRIARTGLEATVQADPRFEVVAVGNRAGDFRSAIRDFEPDVVLLDGAELDVAWQMPVSADQRAAPSLVVLVDGLRRAEVLRVLHSGVRAVLLRESHPDEITAALQAARDGLAVLSLEILELLLPRSYDAAETEDRGLEEALTPREAEVLSLLAEGAGNKQIASKLHISEHTVKFHVSSILSKLGASTRTEAVTRGYKEGLILI